MANCPRCRTPMWDGECYNPNCPPFFDVARGEELKTAAIDRVEEGAPEFVEVAVQITRAVAAVCNEFTTDDVWKALRVRGINPPREPRAMGAVMRAAQAAGFVVATSQYKPSKRPGCHRRPLRVWRWEERARKAGRRNAGFTDRD